MKKNSANPFIKRELKKIGIIPIRDFVNKTWRVGEKSYQSLYEIAVENKIEIKEK